MASKQDEMFTKREVCFLERADKHQMDYLCCAHSGGRFWARETYITDRKDFEILLFVYVEEGSMFLEYDSKSYTLDRGQAFFIDCGPHQIYGAGDSGCVLTFLHFVGGASKYMYEKIYAKHGCVMSGYTAQTIKRCIDDVHSLSKEHTMHKVEAQSAHIFHALCELLSYDEISEPTFESAIDMMREKIASGEQINVEGLAAAAGYSKYYFTRRFKERYGASPYEFILRERVSCAKERLLSTRSAVGDIALECGFFDASHMTNCFKARENMTPTEFRKRWRKPI